MTDGSASIVSTIERHWIDLWTSFGRVAGGEVTESDDRIHTKSGLRRIPYDHVLWCRASGNDSCIDGILDAYRDREAVWTIGPSSDPPDLGRRLVARGCQPFTELTGMSLDLRAEAFGSGELPDGMEIVHVGNEQLLDTWVDLVLDQWHLSVAERSALLQIHQEVGIDPAQPARRWLVFRNDIAIAKISAVFGDGELGVYGVGTTEAARGSGVATAMTRYVLAEARREGLGTAVLHSTPVAVGLYERVGFAPRCTLSVFTLPSPAPGADRGDLTRA